MPESALVKKLGVKPGQRMLILDAPDGYLDALAPLPDGATVETSPEGSFDFVQLFARDIAAADKLVPIALDAARPGAIVWLCYPKKNSKVKTDISRDVGWNTATERGWEIVAAISIDDTWSGSRFRPLSDIKHKQSAATA